MTAITGIVLCGGRGRRLAGVDKPLLAWRGEMLVAQVVRQLVPQVDGILISANRNLGAYRRWGPVVADELPGHQGPLAGISAALGQCTTPWAMVCPGDAPLLPPDLVQRLAEAVDVDGREVEVPRAALARTGARRHPLHCLLQTGLLDHLRGYLADGHRAAQDWLDAIGAVEVDFGDQPGAFRNFNSEEDFVDASAGLPPAGK